MFLKKIRLDSYTVWWCHYSQTSFNRPSEITDNQVQRTKHKITHGFPIENLGTSEMRTFRVQDKGHNRIPTNGHSLTLYQTIILTNQQVLP